MAALLAKLASRTLRTAGSSNTENRDAAARAREIASRHALEEVQEKIRKAVIYSGLRHDVLRFPLLAIAEMAGAQHACLVETQSLLRRAEEIAKTLSDPPQILAPQVAQHIGLSLERVTRAAWVKSITVLSISIAAICVLGSGALLGVGAIWHASRSTEANALIQAAGSHAAVLTKVISLNPADSLRQMCADPRNATIAPNGQRYCQVWLRAESFTADPIPSPTDSLTAGPRR